MPKLSGEKQKLFLEALQYYKNGECDKCYDLISSMAEENIPRACYCKALLDVNPQMSKAEGEQAFISGMKKESRSTSTTAFSM